MKLKQLKIYDITIITIILFGQAIYDSTKFLSIHYTLSLLHLPTIKIL